MFQQYYCDDNPETLLENPEVLSVVSFNTKCEPPEQPGVIPCGVESLSGHTSEVFLCPGSTVERGTNGNVYWSSTSEVTCASIWISEADCNDIEKSTEAAYLELLNHLKESGYPHPFRFWNYIPNINVGPGDREEYKKFCVGRLKAFTELNFPCETFPAASALGHHSEGAIIFVLASRHQGQHHENPNQERAYRYPRQYGPSSPSFSRATSIHVNGQLLVFVSGTASIVGHETQSPESFADQLRITVENIENLSSHISKDAGPLTSIRVYLRHKSDFDQANTYLSTHFPNAEITYTFADICRANLLVEVEATFAIND